MLITRTTPAPEPQEPTVKRLGRSDLEKLDEYVQPKHSASEYTKRVKRAAFEAKRDAFLAAEGAKVWIVPSKFDGGLLTGAAYGYAMGGFLSGQTPKVPGMELAAEDYRFLARLAKSEEPVMLEVVSDVRFHDEDPNAYNILADLPGRDPKAGYVMAGAHLDSWVAADGAADNAAGCVVVMEAARILKTLGVKPRRTIRFALWNAEEPGLLGSMAYIEKHLATRAPEPDPQIAKLNPYFSRSWLNRWPIMPKAGYADLKAYFNLDNGSGKVRGIYTEGNLAVVPTFKQWLAPFASMGATHVVAQPTTGTDHAYLQAVGLPGYQFIQDPLDYDTRIHHSNIDTYDHLVIADMKQAAVILASFLYHSAESAQSLPRMPLPAKPAVTDPFADDQDEE